MYNQEEGEQEADKNKTGMTNVSNLRSASTWTRSCEKRAKT
jgi:hypothetical protein